VQKYFVAQGLASGQSVLIVDDKAEDFVRDVMWIPQSGDEEGEDAELDQNIKIAWRYANMKQFQTTVTYVHCLLMMMYNCTK
jgi:elongator complex protein 4